MPGPGPSQAEEHFCKADLFCTVISLYAKAYNSDIIEFALLNMKNMILTWLGR